MITPVEIQEKEFAKTVRGYKEDEVNEFLDQITLDLEMLITRNEELRKDKERAEGELAKYQGAENSVLETLQAAKVLMEDISVSAEKRASIIMKNAELDAHVIHREAKEAVDRLKEENSALKQRFQKFQGRYKSLLQAELEKFDDLSADFFSGMNIEDLEELPDAKEKIKNQEDTNTKTMVNIK
ncbi:MAG: DivIVA domain-containing protein [Anaerovoracaceae bacterium]